MFTLPLLLILYSGFTHALEADHLLAVSNLVSRRNRIWLSLKDGVFWGLGHSSTILFIGLLMMVFKLGIPDLSFRYFEALVGLMLVLLGAYRLYKLSRERKRHPLLYSQSLADRQFTFPFVQPVPNYVPGQLKLGSTDTSRYHGHTHKLAYGVGLIHGLAGSGALIVLVMSQIKNPWDGLTYLLVFSIGAIAGMLIAAGAFSVPFSRRILNAPRIQNSLVLITSILCVFYGGKVIYFNLFGL